MCDSDSELSKRTCIVQVELRYTWASNFNPYAVIRSTWFTLENIYFSTWISSLTTGLDDNISARYAAYCMRIDTAGRGSYHWLLSAVSSKLLRQFAVCVLGKKGGKGKSNTACAAAVHMTDERFLFMLISKNLDHRFVVELGVYKESEKRWELADTSV